MNQGAGGCQRLGLANPTVDFSAEHEEGFIPGVVMRSGAGALRAADPKQLVAARLLGGGQHRDLEAPDIQRMCSRGGGLYERLRHIVDSCGMWTESVDAIY